MECLLFQNREGVLCVNPCLLPALSYTNSTESLRHKPGKHLIHLTQTDPFTYLFYWKKTLLEPVALFTKVSAIRSFCLFFRWLKRRRAVRSAPIRACRRDWTEHRRRSPLCRPPSLREPLTTSSSTTSSWTRLHRPRPWRKRWAFHHCNVSCTMAFEFWLPWQTSFC